MNRREFVKTSIYMGCAGAIGASLSMDKEKIIDNIPQLKEALVLRKFIYKKDEDLPTKIRLDLCNMCQLNCVKCWVRFYEKEIIQKAGGFGYVSFETFKKFIDKHPFIKEIECSNNGEIFLNPDLIQIIKYAYEKEITLTAFNGVNLNTLSEEVAEALVKYKFSGLTVSIDGATPETYKIYRRGGDFNTVINNIKMINKYKEKYNSKLPKILYQFIIFGHNEHEIEKAKKLAKELNTEIQFLVNYAHDYSPVKNKEKVLKETGLSTLESSYDFQFDNFKKGKLNWFYCTDLYINPQINYNGDLLGCCALLLSDFKTNVFKYGLKKALNSKTTVYAKYMLSDFNIKPKNDIPCGKCYVYDFLKEKNYPIIKEHLKIS